MALYFYRGQASLPLESLIDHLTEGHEMDERNKEGERSSAIGAAEVDLSPC